MSARAIASLAFLAAIALASAIAFFLWGPGRHLTGPLGAGPPAAGPPAARTPVDPKEKTAAPADPRVTFDTPFRNVRPAVAYVGDRACAACHQELCDSFHQHPMGSSAALWSAAQRVESLELAGNANFVGPAGAGYRIEERDGRLWQTEQIVTGDGAVLAESAAEAAVVIGSGRRARSYLSRREGSLWQTGVSWFAGGGLADGGRWDVSPGFHPGEHAQRPVQEGCLFCHVDSVARVRGTEMRYAEPLFARQASIGCERCHGPGALHVAERAAERKVSGTDTSIVNPRHLPPELRDAICQQCHLKGVHQVARRGRSVFDYRPGLPLELFQSVYVSAESQPDALAFVGHVEQMAASRCSSASGGKLSCTSCHDPHRDPPAAERTEYFRKTCLACHADRGCNLPLAERRANGDACASCHMPRRPTADISHTAVTDHRILRRSQIAATNRGEQGALSRRVPIRLFHAGSPYAPPADEQERDLGLALAYLVRVQRAQGSPDHGLSEEAIARLTRATEHFPTDAAAWEALAVVRGAAGDPARSLAAAERALAIEPCEAALHQAAQMALALGDATKARAFT